MVVYQSRFRRQYKKLSEKMQDLVDERVDLYKRDVRNPKLRVHALHGKLEGHLSMDITGDVRAVFEEKEDDGVVVFRAVGTHGQLYG